MGIIKNYIIKSELGQGGMATVYLAEHQLLGSKVAIKILHDEFVRNKNIRSRFIAEAKNMARMSHPNIIKVTDQSVYIMAICIYVKQFVWVLPNTRRLIN